MSAVVENKQLRYLLLGLGGVLIALLLFKAADTAWVMFDLFNWPFQHDESEGMIVIETLLLDQGQNIFAPIDSNQFVAAPYPPLYYLLNWPGIHFLGATFKFGRALTLFSTFGASLLIFFAILKPTRDYLAAATGGLAWLSLSVVGFWGSLVKPDVPAVFFGLAGLVVALYSMPGAQARLWWALPLFWAAFYTKQTAIAPAMAVCVWLLLLRWRTGVRFTLIYIVGAVGGSLLLDFWTGGGYFYHELTLHDLPWTADTYYYWIFGLLSAYWPLLIPGSLALIAVTIGALRSWWLATGGLPDFVRKIGSLEQLGEEGKLRWAAPVILLFGYWATGLIVSIGAGTHGGNHNHLLEWVAGSSIGFGMLVHLLLSRRVVTLQIASAVVLLLMVIFASPIRIGGVASVYEVPDILAREFRVPAPDQQIGWSNMAQYISNTAGTVYSTDMSLLIVTDKWRGRLWTTDPFTQTHATQKGRWDESALLNAIRNKEFALIVLPRSPEDIDAWLQEPDLGLGDVSHGIMQAVREAYDIDQRNLRFIYKPKP